MKNMIKPNVSRRSNDRAGSTLLIVLSLLSILMFLGMVFFTIASQEREAAEIFSENAKELVESPDDPFPHGLRQILVGATNQEKISILHSAAARHAIITNMVGNDLAPFTGTGVNVIAAASGLPLVDNDFDSLADVFVQPYNDPLNFVDSLAAWASTGVNEGTLRTARLQLPQPDAGYTYPDINNIFLSFKGWAIRDNGAAIADPTLRYERVPVIIPSFFRPSLMKSGTANGPGGANTLTDLNWYDDAAHPIYGQRIMRPHPDHIVGIDNAGNPVRRFLDARVPADVALASGLPGGSGVFPLRPLEGGNSADFGKLGIWTGHTAFDPANPPLAGAGIPAQYAAHFELDSDNDRDGIKEGIWLDLAYPVETTSTGVDYVTLFSFTIKDLDPLIDLNVHGNMAAIPRNSVITAQVGAGNRLATSSVSESNQGLSPVEVNPVYALYPTGSAPDSGAEFTDWYTADPVNHLEQANMELLWLLTGRIDRSSGTPASYVIHAGKWGDEPALWYHAVGAGGRNANSLPRPGRAGNIATAATGAIGFGGRQGFDDNQDVFEGIATAQNGVVRGFVHPLDVSGRGRISLLGDPKLPNLLQDQLTRPDRWLQYDQYSLIGSIANLSNDSPYIRGRDGSFGTAADNLVTNSTFNYALDDPNEVIFDNDLTLRPDDAIYSAADTAAVHLVGADIDGAQTNPSTRLQDLDPYALGKLSPIKERFTTLTNSLRYFPMQHHLGPNLVVGGGDDGPRAWEWTGDSDGNDVNDDGIPDGDGKLEFPPSYGGIQPYSRIDPFRAVVRRLLATEAGDRATLLGQLPLSVNHVLDVNRTSQTPVETSPGFLRFLQRSGMRFRSLTEHPDADETDGSGTKVATLTIIPVTGTAAGNTARTNFPPRNLGDREFWARRDRQQMARDIYVLLYTIGGGEISGAQIEDATASNAARTVYTNIQLRRMAQFAVNLVDAMDTDNVITKFEYDKDLNNGWGLDDDAFTDDGFAAVGTPAATEDVITSNSGNGMYPEDSASERGVVYGVEAQQLAFSEALGVYSEMVNPGENLIETAYDDESGHRSFLHLELQNMQPYPVELSRTEVGTTVKENALWRLLRIDRDASTTAPQNDAPSYELSLMDGNAALSGGSTFTIAVASQEGTPADPNPTGFGTADVYVDDDANGTFTLISPDVGLQATTINTGATPTPNCDLDTVHTSHQTRFLANGVTQSGAFLEGAVGAVVTPYHGNAAYSFSQGTPTPADGGFEIVLQRRLNPNLPNVPLAENPFIEVDRIRVPLRKLVDKSGATPTTDIAALRSVERREPLHSGSANSGGHAAIVAGTNWRRNSIGSLMNDVTDDPSGGAALDGMGQFNLWQVHFDRDYANVGELLQLPVVPQRLLTARLDRMRYSPYQQSHQDYFTDPPVLAAHEQWISNAEAMILQPQFMATVVPVPPTADDNRWYRLLQMVEVPSRLNRMLGDYLALSRTPGKVNLNGIRHIEVYAGLLDDPFFATLPYLRDPANPPSVFDADNRYAPFLQNRTPGNSASTDVTNVDAVLPYKDRWFEFIAQRDGVTTTYDPVLNATTSFWIPGTPNANPFHAPGQTLLNVNDNGLSRSIFRQSEVDVGVVENRTWLEVGNQTFHKQPNAQSNGQMRHQLVSKLLNNTTTISNTFVVYGTAAYFEATEDTNGFIRVGGRLDLDGDPVTNGVSSDTTAGWEKRAIFVIDRTEAYRAFDPASGSFDWERLIKYRADLQTDGT